MSAVLYTEQAGSGHVYARRVEGSNLYTQELQRRFGFPALLHDDSFPSGFHWVDNYHPRPGTFEAIGCWSRLKDISK